jgi:hypothetical protein
LILKRQLAAASVSGQKVTDPTPYDDASQGSVDDDPIPTLLRKIETITQ